MLIVKTLSQKPVCCSMMGRLDITHGNPSTTCKCNCCSLLTVSAKTEHTVVQLKIPSHKPTFTAVISTNKYATGITKQK